MIERLSVFQISGSVLLWALTEHSHEGLVETSLVHVNCLPTNEIIN
jgi:hypothetical protein